MFKLINIYRVPQLKANISQIKPTKFIKTLSFYIVIRAFYFQGKEVKTGVGGRMKMRT